MSNLSLNNDFFDKIDLENTFIIGYYGGSNFGDELLLEVLLNKLNQSGVKKASVYYADSKIYKTYHHDFGYALVNPRPSEVFQALIKSDSIVVGGGGLWGLDFNYRIALLSLMLFFGRFVLLKKVYLVGVGAYSSMPATGSFFAGISALSANLILARDKETYDVFSKRNDKTYLACDIVQLIPELDLLNYKDESSLSFFAQTLDKESDVLIISTRHFSSRHLDSKRVHQYNQALERLISAYQGTVLLMLLNSRKFDMENFRYYHRLKNKYSNVVGVVETDFNPIYVYLLFLRNSKKITIISPQYHLQMIAYLSQVRFLPLRYDNKNEQFYKLVGISNWVDIAECNLDILREYIYSKGSHLR